jgi:hypothetical protein
MMSLRVLMIAVALFALYTSALAAAVEASVANNAAKGEKLESAAKMELNPTVKVDNPPIAESVKMETDAVMDVGHDEEAESAGNELEALERSEDLESVERSGGHEYGYKKKYCTRKKCSTKYHCTYKPYYSCYDHCYCVYPKKDYPKHDYPKKDYPKHDYPKKDPKHGGYRAEVGDATESGTGLDTASHSYSKCGHGGYQVCNKKCHTYYKKYCYPQHYCYDEHYPCYH